MKRTHKQETIIRFKEKFNAYLHGKKMSYIDVIRDRWSDQEVLWLFEYGKMVGRREADKCDD